MKIWAFIMMLVGILLALVVSLPLAWVAKPVVPREQFPDLKYSGSIWNGAVNNIEGIGSLGVKIPPKELLKGRPNVRVSSFGSPLNIQGSLNTKRLEALSIDGPISALGFVDEQLAQFSGRFSVKAKGLALAEVCEGVSGRVHTDVLSKNAAEWYWTGPILSGPITCDGEDLKVTVTGRDAQQSIEAILRVQADGRYRLNASVQTDQAGADQLLPLYGFRKNQSGYKLSETGQWR